MQPTDFIDWQLIRLYLKGEATATEAEQVEQWLKADPAHEAYLKAAAKAWQEDIPPVVHDPESSFRELLPRLSLHPAKSLVRRHLWAYAAACLLAGLLFCYWFYPFAAFLPNENTQLSGYIHPGSPKATLVLESGESISLGDSLLKIELQGVEIQNDTIHNLVYLAHTSETITQNRLIVPRGGEYCVTLSDGTIVWLNSESELIYPTVFSGKHRKVELKGEAFFKVRPNAEMPFIVTAGNYHVEVLGTEFNLCAYPDESEKTTTLLKGKVKVNIDELTAGDTLSPNMQLIYHSHQHRRSIQQVNAETYCSWREGHFEFDHTSLEQFMRVVARWYNFDYQIKDASLLGYHFTGAFRKSDNIDDLFRILHSSKIPVEITYQNKQVILDKKYN